ncbi:MAG: 4-hydroxythreonine-4-phosphate dehydrogenase PdxA [Pseudomonadota bacterium]
MTTPLAITAGEPAGVGPELCLKLAERETAEAMIVIGDADQLEQRARDIGSDVQIDVGGPTTGNGKLAVVHIAQAEPATPGTPLPANAAALLEGLRHAVKGCQNDTYSALVTGPLQKSVINDAGIPFSGHTEFLAELTGAPLPVMLLTAGELRVALASTHLPLRDVADYVTAERLQAVIEVLHQGLVSTFGIAEPSIHVCGLNPHAGEGGHLGIEDDNVIAPALKTLRQRGMHLNGPLPADTAFTPAAGHADAVLAMYHDQGLPVIKHAGFGRTVNVTLGLPIIRTSVDHGTALDIAGSGNADPGSLFAAIDLAQQMVGHR